MHPAGVGVVGGSFDGGAEVGLFWSSSTMMIVVIVFLAVIVVVVVVVGSVYRRGCRCCCYRCILPLRRMIRV